MDDLIVGEGSLKLQTLSKAMTESLSFSIVLQNWKCFARNLEINDAEILQIERNINVGVWRLEDVPYELLLIWRASKGSGAKIKILNDALVACNAKDVAEFLEEKFRLVQSFKFCLGRNSVTLEELFPQAVPDEVYKLVCDETRAVNSVQPIQLFQEQVSVPDESEYYIPRIISYMAEVDEKMFKHELAQSHRFLFKGIKKPDLAKVSGYKPVDMSGNQIDEVNVRFIVLECDEDFYMICKITEDPVHVIEFRENRYHWIKSSGGLDIIRRFLLKEKQTFKEDDLLKRVEIFPHPIIVADTPGMGKTFLLASLANQILKKDSKSLVLFIVLAEFAKKIRLVNSPSMAIEEILAFACDMKICKRILKEVLVDESATRCLNLFLDGYDEVSESKLSEVDAFLTHLKVLKNIRVFVSTRPHTSPDLENVLNVLSYEVMPFQKSCQVEFLEKYWKTLGAQPGERLKSYARKCLETLHDQMTDKEWEIAGIPLQCRMLADFYGKHAKRASIIRHETTEIVKITSLFDMYKSLVGLKLKRIPKDFKNFFSISYWRKKTTKKSYFNAHVYHSISLLFPDWIEKFKQHMKGLGNVNQRVLFSIGLLEKTLYSSMPRFVHRTYAEYLLAEYLVKNLSKRSECIEMTFNLILNGEEEHLEEYTSYPVGYKMMQPVIAYFVNMHLKDHIKLNPYDQLAQAVAMHHRNRHVIYDVYKTVAVCGSNDFETCFELLCKVFYYLHTDNKSFEHFMTVKDWYFKLLPHLVTENTESLSLIEKVLDFSEQELKVDLTYHVLESIDPEDYPWIVKKSFNLNSHFQVEMDRAFQLNINFSTLCLKISFTCRKCQD